MIDLADPPAGSPIAGMLSRAVVERKSFGKLTIVTLFAL